MSPEYAAWLRAADGEWSARPLHWRRGAKVFGRFACEIWIPRGTRGDLDNRAKAILDWLERVGVIEDDRLCDRLVVSWWGGAWARVRLAPADFLGSEVAARRSGRWHEGPLEDDPNPRPDEA